MDEFARLRDELGSHGIMVLSTCCGDRPTSRSMSVVITGGRFCCQTKATPHDPCASVCATSTGVEAQIFVRLPKFDAGLQAKFTSLYATSRRIWVI